mmetsp:Transcript_14222/g.36001  ORF Transcript_14222/g.36001 Transcript_14222/m.36001 type:complete len:217 (+) Transcript_14222:1360-2010(+)
MHIAHMYYGNACEPLSDGEKTSDVAFVGTMYDPDDSKLLLDKRVRFRKRWDVCGWLGDQDSVTVGACGPGEQCPVLAEARLGLHMRGDTWGSNRLMDILLSETVPVMTDRMQYQVLPPFMPWDKMTVLANIDTKQDMLHSLQTILNGTSREYQRVRQFNLDNNVAALVDWEEPHLFNLYMAAFYTFFAETFAGDDGKNMCPECTRIDGTAKKTWKD